MTPVGFPHSGTPGSQDVCSSPGTIAACRALRRLPMPRHPPCAPKNLRPARGRIPGRVQTYDLKGCFHKFEIKDFGLDHDSYFRVGCELQFPVWFAMTYDSDGIFASSKRYAALKVPRGSPGDRRLRRRGPGARGDRTPSGGL